jgi:hypothetical protein
MSVTNDKDREEQALDALIVAALCQDEADPSTPPVAGDRLHLTREDQEALERLGPVLVERLMLRSSDVYWVMSRV